MIALPQYKVLGGDGVEYGPVYDEQIRAWILEGRLEKKSPVEPPDAKDWVFLGDLPEFAEAFRRFKTPEQARRAARWRMAIVLLALGGMVLLVLLKLIRHHHH